MEYRTIKNTDLKLSVIGTGCWAFGGGEYWGNQNQKDVNEVVHASVVHGINYFDTAEAYNEGRSEASLGEAIQGISRDKLIIGTKISPLNAYAGTLEQHCEASLKRLQTDYIDIYMIHWPLHPHSIKHFTNDEKIINDPPTIYEAFNSLLKLQKAGKIRHIGISNFSFKRLKEDIPSNVQVVVNELPYNLLCRAIELDTLPYCEQKGIGIIGYMTLMQGILAGSYPTLKDVPAWQRRTRHFDFNATDLCRHGESGFEAETQETLLAIERVAKEQGMKMAEISTKWAIAKSGITCSLVGARNATELELNVKSVETGLDPEVVAELNQVTDELKDKLGNHFDYYESKENDRTL
jgi:myo-inositol catabolism protein IolS